MSNNDTSQQQQQPQPQQQQMMFAGLRSTVERSALNWRSTFANAVLRPLVQQHRVQQQIGPPPSSSAAQATNQTINLIRSPSAHSTNAHNNVQSVSPTSSSSAVVINVDGHDESPRPSIEIPPTLQYGESSESIQQSSSADGRPSATTTPTATTTTTTTTTNNNGTNNANNATNGNSAPTNNANNANANANEANSADILVQMPEARQLVEALLRYLPYICILAIKYMFDHLDGILYIALLLAMFWHANHTVKKQIGRQKHRSVFVLLRELVYVTIVALVVAIMLFAESTWMEFFELPAGWMAPIDDWSLRKLLYHVLAVDMLAKLVTVDVKIMVTLLPPCVLNYRIRVCIIFEQMSLFICHTWELYSKSCCRFGCRS